VIGQDEVGNQTPVGLVLEGLQEGFGLLALFLGDVEFGGEQFAVVLIELSYLGDEGWALGELISSGRGFWRLKDLLDGVERL
jgi:hypothetical protein